MLVVGRRSGVLGTGRRCGWDGPSTRRILSLRSETVSDSPASTSTACPVNVLTSSRYGWFMDFALSTNVVYPCGL